MDKITDHHNIVQALVEEIGGIATPSFKDIETQIIIDKKKRPLHSYVSRLEQSSMALWEFCAY